MSDKPDGYLLYEGKEEAHDPYWDRFLCLSIDQAKGRAEEAFRKYGKTVRIVAVKIIKLGELK